MPHEQSRSAVPGKKGLIAELVAVVADDPEGMGVYADESWFVGKVYGGCCWGQRGKRTWIPAFGPKQEQTLYWGWT